MIMPPRKTVRKLDPLYHRMMTTVTADEEVLFNAIELEDLKNEAKRKESYTWKGTIRPSDLDWDMCPAKYPESRKSYNKSTTEQEKTMMGGRVLHLTYLSKAKNHPDLLWPERPSYPPEILAFGEKALKKAEDVWPSYYIGCPEFGINGEVDLNISINDKPVIVDFKFPQVTDVEKWEALRKMLPLTKTTAQLCCYAYIVNKYKLFSKTVEMVGAAHRNPYMSLRENPIREVYIPYTEVEEERIVTLLSHLRHHANLFMSGDDPELCEYEFCKEHHGK